MGRNTMSPLTLKTITLKQLSAGQSPPWIVTDNKYDLKGETEELFAAMLHRRKMLSDSGLGYSVSTPQSTLRTHNSSRGSGTESWSAHTSGDDSESFSLHKVMGEEFMSPGAWSGSRGGSRCGTAGLSDGGDTWSALSSFRTQVITPKKAISLAIARSVKTSNKNQPQFAEFQLFHQSQNSEH